MLFISEKIPAKLLDVSAQQLHEILPGPTLIHLSGRRQQPLFVSVLMHGNEDTGFVAAQKILREFQNKELPRSLSLFIANISAAKKNVRRLDNQPDYNRIWPGSDDIESPEALMMKQVFEEMKKRQVFASVDIHNNTGTNPFYACVNRLEHKHLQLATLFSRIVLYFIHPQGVQSIAMSKLCPAVTLECGKVNSPNNEQIAYEYINACLHLSELPAHSVAAHDIELFHTVAQVKVPNKHSFSFSDKNADIVFHEDIDHMNFRELPAGTVLGSLKPNSDAQLQACSEAGIDISREFFNNHNNQINLEKAIMPAMLTLNEEVIRQDCLCYLMERLDLSSVPD